MLQGQINTNFISYLYPSVYGNIAYFVGYIAILFVKIAIFVLKFG
jgi:hypothetical protein